LSVICYPYVYHVEEDTREMTVEKESQVRHLDTESTPWLGRDFTRPSTLTDTWNLRACDVCSTGHGRTDCVLFIGTTIE
jgi:hypothetical protein